jgi:RNase P subunit RPR2
MAWWEIFAIGVMLLTLYGLRRLKRFVADVPSSPQFRPFSTRTSPKPTLSGRDHARTFHVTACPKCDGLLPVPLTATRLEWRPWRVEWDCAACGETVFAQVGEGALDVLLAAEVAGGMRLSHREVRQARLVDWDVEAQQL